MCLGYLNGDLIDIEINLQYFTTVYTRWLIGLYKSFRLKFNDI